MSPTRTLAPNGRRENSEVCLGHGNAIGRRDARLSFLILPKMPNPSHKRLGVIRQVEALYALTFERVVLQ